MIQILDNHKYRIKFRDFNDDENKYVYSILECRGGAGGKLRKATNGRDVVKFVPEDSDDVDEVGALGATQATPSDSGGENFDKCMCVTCELVYICIHVLYL
jgi:hypothetical protein